MDDMIRSFIEKSSNINISDNEKTFFDVGMRGYYENPMSDVLAFYLNPIEQHQFGAVILEEFLSCCDLDELNPTLIGSPIRERDHIDIFLNSKDWVLVIENKIFHVANNPFDKYENRARDYAGDNKRIHFVILAPYDPKIPKWKWVPTRLFIKKLKLRLSTITIQNKWRIFLADFLTSLERVLEPMKYSTLTEADLQYLSDNLRNVKQVSDLLEAYYQSIFNIVMPIAKEIFEHPDVKFSLDDWGELGKTPRIKPYQNLGHKIHILSPPYPEKMDSELKFRVQYYIRNRTDAAQYVKAKYMAQNFRYLDVEEGGTFYSFYSDVDTIGELVNTVSDACQFIKECHNGISKNE
jgi:hypothetical protein